MNIASKLQKVTQMDPRVLPAEQAFAMATIDGARVLGMDHEIGSLETGKRADLITISLNDPNAVPLYNVYSQLAYATKAAQVGDVFIHGRQIVNQRQVLTLHADEIYRKAGEYKQRIVKSVS
jgi:5-methylthioadenosine/S-adenosylhomocysteine deaminase